MSLRFLKLAAFASVALAQTLQIDNKEIPADSSNVAPAAEPVSSSDSAANAELFNDESFQLTDAVLANLTDLGLSNVSLFTFHNETTGLEKRSLFGDCKTAPGDFLFPSDIVWKVLDLLLGGALKKTVPYASVCFNDFGNYNEAKCNDIVANWVNNSYQHIEDPTSINAILFEDLTCVPPAISSAGTDCTVGGFPVYTVDATNVAHIQLAINLARNLNLRLVIKNTGHDFGAKSTGYGALSIWTHNLKNIKFYESYKDDCYSGPAFKLGAGVQAYEAYEAANKYGVSLVGGEGQTVGLMGGYVQGGGHSPLSGLYGMAADQVLSYEAVTADGRFITVSKKSHPDLFWALRGGGGSTYAVVTSAVVKARPKLNAVTIMTFQIVSGVNGVTNEMFWEAFKSFFKRFPEFARDNGNYEYFVLTATPTGGFSFSMAPWFAPGFTEAQLRELVAPMFAEWKDIGLDVDATYQEFDDFYPAWQAGFPLEPWGSATIRQGSRLFPAENWSNDTILDDTFEVVKGTIEDGAYLIAFNIFAGPSGYPDSAVNPAWRKTLFHAIGASFWNDNDDEATKKAASDKLTFNYIQKWRDITPGAGAYMSESDYIEPNFQQAFWGYKYERALELKQKWDPTDLFYATNAIGSEFWELQGKIFGNLPSQNSKLCRAK